MAEIRIYCEGGGDGPNTKDPFREGIRTFLKELYEIASEKRIQLRLIICGGRTSAYDNFKTALQIHRDAVNILLVDAEAPVTKTPWLHLKQRDNWDALGCSDEQCHLMVQTMEAWLLADPEALATFYGQGFNVNALPKNRDVEKIDKPALAKSLNNAIRQTNKPEYLKIRHGAELLKLIAPVKVRQASQHCDRMFKTISLLMNEA
jgi:Domain of unknown function (DUF4276)